MTHSEDSIATNTSTFPIVGIGASAGGLEALRQLFAHVPDETGMAFVVILHLDPNRPSMLASVLASDVRMPVVQITDGMPLQPNRVHVIGPGVELGVRDGVLILTDRDPGRKLHLPIDAFLRALADDQPTRAVGVVLSGSASDGTEGLRAIKAAGGIACAQTPESAQFRSMPESAIAAGVVDFCGTPEEIGAQLGRMSHHAYLAVSDPDSGPNPNQVAATDQSPSARPQTEPESEAQSLSTILATVLRHARIDFKGYKRSTIARRIARRMALRSLDSMAEYASVLRNDADEAKALAQDVLIHVTSFFRDPDAFAALSEEVLPQIIERKHGDAPIRVWVPGCSTGQEAYSIAMCLLERLGEQAKPGSIKVFGSDVSELAISVARVGLYTEREMEGVTPERRTRFFDRVDDRFRMSRQVRELCVFAKHDLTRDPPFARLDLISCRNVLIYFDTELQQRLLPVLHHSLDDHGYLFLGRSESVSGYSGLFAPVDQQHRIFLKVGESPRIDYPAALGTEAESRFTLRSLGSVQQVSREAQRQADHLLLARYAPPGAIINERLEVVQFRGRTGAFLEPPPGQPQANILRMAREGLAGHLHEAIEEAKSQATTVRKERVRLWRDGRSDLVDVEVVPLAGEPGERHFLILFEAPTASKVAVGEPKAPPVPPTDAATTIAAEELRRAEAELTATRDYLHVVLAEHQDAAQDLAAANEEMVAANEEFQATNEELESAKEELQSTNEELTTLNDELHSRNQDLDLIANDLVSVLESVEIPVVIVDQALRIRRFTPVARDISWIRPGDVGRPIGEVKLRVDVGDLDDKITRCITRDEPGEWEVQGRGGHWFRLRIRPYRTADGRLDGAVLSFIDVDVLKRAAWEAEQARDFSRGIVETVPIPLVVLDASMHIVSINEAFHRSFEDPDGAEGSEGLEGLPPVPEPFDLTAGSWALPPLREAVEHTLSQGSQFRDLELAAELPGMGRRILSFSGSPIPGKAAALMVLAIDDVTASRMLEASEREARIGAEQANQAKDLFLATLSHELRTPLATILMSAQVLEVVAAEEARVRQIVAVIGRAVAHQSRLIDDLLDISRIVSGKLMLALQDVDLAVVVNSALEAARPSAEPKDIGLVLDVPTSVGFVHGDPVRLQQVVANLLHNAIKFTPRGGTISVVLEAVDGRARLTVSDNGIGIDPKVLPHLFDRFVQAEDSMTRAHGGLGLGLAIVRHLVDVHGGEVHAQSLGLGKGATFQVTLPLTVPAILPVPNLRSSVARSIRGVRVLLVEDDEDTRDAFVAALTELGAEVRGACSVTEGLAAVEQERPQVILCDIAMPVEDGYSFIRKLRERGVAGGSEIPAAALTALASEEDRARSLSAGFQLHLTKPIDAASLATAVGALADWHTRDSVELP